MMRGHRVKFVLLHRHLPAGRAVDLAHRVRRKEPVHVGQILEEPRPRGGDEPERAPATPYAASRAVSHAGVA